MVLKIKIIDENCFKLMASFTFSSSIAFTADVSDLCLLLCVFPCELRGVFCELEWKAKKMFLNRLLIAFSSKILNSLFFANYMKLCHQKHRKNIKKSHFNL